MPRRNVKLNTIVHKKNRTSRETRGVRFWDLGRHRLWKSLVQYFPLVLIVGGILMMSASGIHAYFRLRSLRLGKELVQQYQQELHPVRKPKPVKIAIQWFLVDVPIEEEVYKEGQWSVSETEASHLADSANPGESGNIIIYGHNKREIMGNIRALKGGEIIHLSTEDGVDHHYHITHMKEVEPTQTEFLQPTDHEVLTLYTCSGFWDKKRFVVQAEPIVP